MQKFIKVKSYPRGYDFPAEDFVLNASLIVSFHQSCFNGENSEQIPNVYLETTKGCYYVAGTVDELLALIEGKEGA